MRLDGRFLLASGAAVIAVAAVAVSVFLLKQTQGNNDELAEARRSLAHQVRVSQRLESQLEIAQNGTKLQGLGQSLAALDARGTDPDVDEPRATPPIPEAAAAASDPADAAERNERMRVAIREAEALVTHAVRLRKWTEQDRDRLQELLVDVNGPERRRIESSVGRLLVTGELVTDGDFLPL